MALRFVRSARQRKQLDAADETLVLVRSPVFRSYAPSFEKVGFNLQAFAEQLADASGRARAAYTGRSAMSDAYEAESGDVQDVLQAFDAWVDTLHAAARAVSVTDHRLAGSIERIFKVGAFDVESVEQARNEGPALVHAVEALGDLSDIGLDPEFVARGRALLDQLVGERNEQWEARLPPLEETRALHAALDEVSDLMERFARFREFAMKRFEVEIPDLSLAAIRASLAGRASGDVQPVATVPEPEAPAPAPVPAAFDL